MEESRVEASANPETCQKPGFEVGIFLSGFLDFSFLVDFLFWAVWQIWLAICPGNPLGGAGGTRPGDR